MAAVLDDFEARPGSATSLARSVIGMYVRQLGGWVAISDFIELMDALGCPAPQTRTTVARLKKKGLLVSEARGGVSGYSLASSALGMLQRGDRRIYHYRHMNYGDPWCLVSFTVPESRRDARHQLRQRLTWIGCGVVAPALWICPGFLLDEVQEIVHDLDLVENCALFLTTSPIIGGSLRDAVAAWWDLDRVAQLHHDFVASRRDALASYSSQEDLRTAFALYVSTIDAWRIVPYLDPGLPYELLPVSWPGRDSVELFERIKVDCEPMAAAFVGERTGTTWAARSRHSGPPDRAVAGPSPLKGSP